VPDHSVNRVTAFKSVIAMAAKTVTPLSVTTATRALFRRVCDGCSAPATWSRFLRRHYVRVGVVLWGQSCSKEMQDSVECLMEKVHEVAHSFVVYLTSRGHRQLFSVWPFGHAAQDPSGQ
jgi:hypothetical protein